MSFLNKRVAPSFLVLSLVFISGCSEEFDTVPDPPSEVKAVPDDSQITLLWSPSLGATVHTILMAPVLLTEIPGSADSGNTAPILVELVDGNGAYGSVELDPGESFLATFISDLALTPTIAVDVKATFGAVTVTVNGQSVTLNVGQNYTFVLMADWEDFLPVEEIFSGELCCEFTRTGLTNGVGYFFVVTAANRIGESGNSLPVFATPEIP